MENETEATSGANSSEMSTGCSDANCSDGMGLGSQNDITQQQAEARSCIDTSSLGRSSSLSAGECHKLGSETNEVTKVKSKPVVMESSKNCLLDEENGEMKESEKSDPPKARLRRLDDISEAVQVNEAKGGVRNEKGVSSLTRKRLAEFRAPGQVGDVKVQRVESLNVTDADPDQKKNVSKAGGNEGKVKKEVQKKGFSGNLLSFVTKMKFDTIKVKIDSDLFKQDDCEIDFDLDMLEGQNEKKPCLDTFQGEYYTSRHC